MRKGPPFSHQFTIALYLGRGLRNSDLFTASNDHFFAGGVLQLAGSLAGHMGSRHGI